jgi:aminoglycoside phosphotransferase (APT) family kinase protein
MCDTEGQLTGLIDWGEVHAGDPALDLSIAWSFLPPTAHAAFRSHYGHIDEATWRRAKFKAIHYAVIVMGYALDIGDLDLQREMTQTLAWTTQQR